MSSKEQEAIARAVEAQKKAMAAPRIAAQPVVESEPQR